MGLVVSGMPSRQIAGRLGTSEVTVKIHRGWVMRKMQSSSLAELVRMAARLDATSGAGEPGGRYPGSRYLSTADCSAGHTLV